LTLREAFLSAPWKPGEPIIYISIPTDVTNIWVKFYPEYRQYVHSDGKLYMRMYKYIYGLKQSSRKFNEHLHGLVTKDGFKRSISDECLYIKASKDYLQIIGVHVDDLLVLSAIQQDLTNFRVFLRQHFDLNTQDSNDFSYLGLAVKRDRCNRTTTVSQEHYFNAIIQKYLPNVNYLPRTVPIDPTYPVQEQIGNCSFTYKGTDLHLQFFIDASHGIHRDGRGHSAIAATLGSSPILTRSVKQKLVALHSTDAEIYAVVEGLTYVIWIRVLLSELQFEFDGPTPIYQDNQSAMLIYQGGGNFKRSKHLLVKRNFIKDLLDRKIVEFRYLASAEIPTDPLSKPVPGNQIKRMLDYFSMINN